MRGFRVFFDKHGSLLRYYRTGHVRMVSVSSHLIATAHAVHGLDSGILPGASQRATGVAWNTVSSVKAGRPDNLGIPLVQSKRLMRPDPADRIAPEANNPAKFAPKQATLSTCRRMLHPQSGVEKRCEKRRWDVAPQVLRLLLRVYRGHCT